MSNSFFMTHLSVCNAQVDHSELAESVLAGAGNEVRNVKSENFHPSSFLLQTFILEGVGYGQY